MKVSPRSALPSVPDDPETLPTEIPPPAVVPVTPALPPTEPPAKDASGFFTSFDLLLAAGVVVLGFAIGSFAIRNSDFWLHLGTGRLIAHGEYEFGRAPFTFVGADRHYTNHSWLFDLGLFGIFSAGNEQGPALLVAIKAAAISLLALLLLLTTRSIQTLWFSVLTVGLALLASAPELLMQPIVASFLFFGATLFLLIQLPRKASPIYLPIAVAALFWFWANLDAWFILGPLTVALFLIGQLIQKPSATPSEPGASRRTLVLTLVAGSLACMLNPHHIHIWQLPPELASTEVANSLGRDPELGYLFRSTIGSDGLDFSGDAGGNPLNAWALILLIILSLAGFALNFRALSVGLTALWVFLFVLAILRTRAMPFFSIVAALSAAENLAAFALRRPKPLLAAASVPIDRYATRALTFFAGVALLIASWPGWLQPLEQHRRLAWRVEIDEALHRTAEEIQNWRTRAENPLPQEVHGIMLQTALADYCAWFAPSEKTFFDSRVLFHEPELKDFLEARRYLTPVRKVKYSSAERKPADESATTRSKNFSDLLERNGIVYLTYGSTQRTENLDFLKARWNAQTAEGRVWENWSFHGRVVVLGWGRQNILSRKQFESMTFNSIAKAFGPDVQTIATPEFRGTLPRVSLAERFLDAPPPEAAEAEESIVLSTWLEHEFQRQNESYNMFRQLLAFSQDALNPSWNVIPRPFNFTTPARELSAFALLSLRTARQAIVASPQNSEGYLALALAYMNPVQRTALSDIRDYNTSIAMMSLERFLARTNPQDRLRRGDLGVLVRVMQLYLYQADRSEKEHPRRNKMDRPKVNELALETIRLVRSYLRSMTTQTINIDLLNTARASLNLGVENEVSAEALESTIKRLDELIVEMEIYLKEQTDLYLVQTREVKSPVERARFARRGQALDLKAVEELRQFDRDETKGDIKEQYEAILELTDLLLILGQVEEAVATIEATDGMVMSFPNRLVQNVKGQVTQEMQQYFQLTQARWLEIKLRAYYAQGDFDRLIEMFRTKATRFRDQPINWPPFWGKPPQNQSQDWLIWGQLVPLFSQLLKSSAVDAGKHGGAMVPIFTFDWGETNFGTLTQFAGQRVNEMSLAHLRLAFTYLEQGDNRAAKQQFEQAFKPFGLDIPHPHRADAEYYFKLLSKGGS